MSGCFITGDGNLDHLVKVICTGFFVVINCSFPLWEGINCEHKQTSQNAGQIVLTRPQTLPSHGWAVFTMSGVQWFWRK